ncbi:MAG: TetR/AcrR family transcriptional regulator [Alphaproteobacteria bacterium]|nr:TetR/AcrR family transcriptional regulator [Alphaproteobacteria bacterium]
MSRDVDDTRTRILNAAWQLLEQGAGKGVRMADVAALAGVSRQAVYLHFPSRAELLIETTRHIDAMHDVAGRLAASRAATGGLARLEAFIDTWSGYIPEVHGVCSALLAMRDTDAAAAAAWHDRMAAVREGCAAAVAALSADGMLRTDIDGDAATDILWTLLSVRNWEHLRQDCGWPQDRYVAAMKDLARRALTTD